MKKFAITLVMMVMVVLSGNAQIIKDTNGVEIILANGLVYSTTDIPGSQWMKPGDNMSVKIANYFNYLRRSDMEEYQREYNLYMMNPPQPIRTTTGMMVGGVGGGVGMVGGMYGTGMQNTGMVMGAGGMAGATSTVNIDNGNMVSTIGSGVNVMYDSGTNSLNVSGDPLMAVGRVVSAIGSSKKAKRQAQQAQQNVRVVYVDASTGQIIGQQQPQQQVQYVQVQPQQQTQVVYNATTGQYVQQQTQPVQQVRQQTVRQQQPVQQVRQQTVQQQQTTTNNVGAATTSDYSTGF